MAHDIDEAIATYLTGLRVEGKADRTISTYAETLRDFRRVGEKLDLPGTIEAYEIEHVYTFIGDLMDRGAAPSYQHRRHREVRTFFSWCLKKMRWIERNPFAAVDLIRLQEKIVPPLAPEDIERLLGLFDASKHTGCRNRALVLYMLDTGVRVSECISVRLEDLDWEHGRQLVRNTKNKKERWVGFVPQTAEALRDYVDHFRGEEPGPLFLTSRTHAPMASGNTVRTMLRRAAASIGLEGVHPHRFRHTFATWAIQSGAREIDVQMLLGHSSVTMVQRYSRTYTSEQAVLAHADLSPVAQLAALEVTRTDDARAEPEPPPAPAPMGPQPSHRGFAAGQTLVARFRGEQYTCEVVERDGRLVYVLPSGDAYTSPSGAGRAITGSATNGYRFWSVGR